MEAGMEAVYLSGTRPTWSWLYLLKTVFISTCLLQVILAPGVGAAGDGGEDTGDINPNPGLNTGASVSNNSDTSSNSLSSLLFNSGDTTISVRTNSASGVQGSTTTVTESVEEPATPAQTSTTVTAPLSSVSSLVVTTTTTTTTTTTAPHLIPQSPGSQNKTDVTTPEALSSNTNQTVPSQVEYTTSSLDIDASDNSTVNRTLTTLPTSPFNLNSRVKLAVVAVFVAIVVLFAGRYACKKIEKRMVRTGDEEYVNILDDAFSMGTEENVWDARWSTGKKQQPSQAATGEETDPKISIVGEDSSLRAEHQRVTLHVPGSRPYGATESLRI